MNLMLLLKQFLDVVLVVVIITFVIFATALLGVMVVSGPRQWEQETIIKERIIWYKDNIYVVEKLRMVTGCNRCHNNEL